MASLRAGADMGGVWYPRKANVVIFHFLTTIPTFSIYTPPLYSPKRKDPLFVRTIRIQSLTKKKLRFQLQINKKLQQFYTCRNRDTNPAFSGGDELARPVQALGSKRWPGAESNRHLHALLEPKGCPKAEGWLEY